MRTGVGYTSDENNSGFESDDESLADTIVGEDEGGVEQAGAAGKGVQDNGGAGGLSNAPDDMGAAEKGMKTTAELEVCLNQSPRRLMT